MINILPEAGRQDVRKAYLLRLATISLYAGAAVALCTGALLFPSYLLTAGAQDMARAEADRLAGAKGKESERADAPITLARSEMTAFSQIAAQTLPSEYIGKVLGAKDTNILITQIQYDAVKRSASLSGTASTRETLLSFVQRVRKVAGVTSADVPVNDLVKSQNPRFTLQIQFGVTTSTP